MSECQRTELRDRLPEYVHGTLGVSERAEVQTHVAACAACRDEVALLRGLRGAIVRRTPTVNVERVATAVRSARLSRTMPSTRPSLARVRGPVPQYVWRAAAAVALVATAAVGYWVGTLRTSTSPAPQMAVGPAPVAPAAVPGVVPQPVTVPLKHETHDMPAAAATGLSFGGGVADLPAAQVGALIKDLDGLGAAISADPEPDVDLGSGQ